MSDSRASLTISHSTLIKLAKQLGYFAGDTGDEGICFGIAHMAMQAILAQDVEQFNERLELMNVLMSEDLVSEIERVKEKYKEKGTRAKQIPDERDKAFFDILAFFDGAELYFQAYLHPDWFEATNRLSVKDAEKTWHLTLSDKLEKMGGISSILKEKEFSGVYTQDELRAYFKLLEEGCKTQTSPVCFGLVNDSHAIMLGYDPAKGWYFADANGLPIKNLPIDNQNKYLLSDDLVSAVFDAFSDKETTAFATKVYATTHAKQAIEKALASVIETDAWKKIHDVSSKKYLTDSEKSKWLYLAAKNDHLETMEALLKAGSDVSAVLKGDYTALHVAARSGHIDIINVLIEANPELIDIAMNDGHSALHIAVGGDQLIAAQLLLDKGANPNFQNNNGNSPLHFAVQMKNKEMVSVLLHHQADIFLQNAKSETPFLLAIKNNHIDLLEQMLHGYLRNEKRLQGDEKESNRAIHELASQLIEHEKVLAPSVDDSYQKKEALNACRKQMVLAESSQSAEKISVEFNLLNKLANALSEIEVNYHPKKEERKEGKSELKTAIDNAYLDYASSQDARESLNQLIDVATEIGNKAEADHNKTGSLRLFGTKSRLKKHIETAINEAISAMGERYSPSSKKNP